MNYKPALTGLSIFDNAGQAAVYKLRVSDHGLWAMTVLYLLRMPLNTESKTF